MIRTIKRLYLAVPLILLALVQLRAPIASANQTAEKITRIVVFDSKNETEHENLGRQVAERTRIIITGFEGFEVIDRGVMKTKLSERGMNIDEITDFEMGLEAVKHLDSDYFIVGDIERLGSLYGLSIKLVDSKTGTVVKAEGRDFKDLVEIREIVKVLLSEVLSYVKTLGKPVISEEEYEKIKKDPSTALSISVGSTIGQAVVLGATLLIPTESNPNHIFPSIALVIPPITQFYTEDWSTAPITIGYSIAAGTFYFLGRLLIDQSQGDFFRSASGALLVFLGAGAKIYAIVTDIQTSTISAEKYNDSKREK